jgi:RNA polymerase sigma-70 factor (ECF subfamily)
MSTDGSGESPPHKRRAVQVGAKSISAAKRDAKFMANIRDKKCKSSLTDLFSIYGPKLKGWLMARGVGNGTAEDIVQDVMITVWTRAHLFDPAKASFATWIYRTTRNRWIDHQRKHSRMDVREPEFMKIIVDDEVPSAEYNFMQEQDAQRLYAEIEKLSETQKSAVKMAFMEFKTHKDISEQTGIPLGTVKTRIRSAVQSLKANMSKDMSNFHDN